MRDDIMYSPGTLKIQKVYGALYFKNNINQL